MRTEKEKISCPALGDCNPADCIQPEKAASCPEWNRYKKTGPEEAFPFQSAPSETKGLKRMRGKDLSLIEEIIADLSGMKDILPLISWKALLLHYRGTQEKNSCAYLRALNKDGLLPPEINLFEAVAAHNGAKWTKEERMLNKRVLNGMVRINKAINNLAAVLLTTPQIRKWLVDRMGPGCKRLLPDWDKYRKNDKAHNKPDFDKALSVFDRFIGGMSSKELGFNKSNYHDFRYRIVPQGEIVLLEWLHNLLYGKIDEAEFFLQIAPDSQKFVGGLMLLSQALDL